MAKIRSKLLDVMVDRKAEQRIRKETLKLNCRPEDDFHRSDLMLLGTIREISYEQLFIDMPKAQTFDKSCG